MSAPHTIPLVPTLCVGIPLVPTLRARTPRSAYIHVPFCAYRCGYCDFTLVARRDDLIDPYLEALEIDLASLGEPRPVDTLYFGGGTPTRLSPRQLERLLTAALRWFPPEPGCEISVEANPHGLDDDRIAALADQGVNRVSLGGQSFDPDVLKTLERDHNRAEVASAFERLRRRIENVGLDLIFGVPGQSVPLWEATLGEAVAMRPTHLSTYGLTFEKGTAFWSRRNRGTLWPIDEETERTMYGLAMDRLPAAGFGQYELSNFAREGFRCRHNEAYWAQADFFGHGPGAARCVGGVRSLNHRSVTTWIRRIRAGQSPISEEDRLSPEDRAREAAMLGLRRTAGILRAEFVTRTGFALEAVAGRAIARHVQGRLLETTPTHIRLTREGRFLADTVAADVLCDDP